jgi:uncharacterized protein (DUF1800 family)
VRKSTSFSRTTALVTVAFASFLATAPAVASTLTAVEFYNAKLNHYFITAAPAEAVALDEGNPVKGWTRTGGQFTVYEDASEGGVPVCRFFGTPGKGLNSHFYTADPAECAKVKTYPAWTYEGIAFYVPLPKVGKCDAGTQPVYRNYFSDQISDANHRFTVDLTVHVRMPAVGFAIEGLVMCAPLTGGEINADAVRLLEQASLGPTEAAVGEIDVKGPAAWIDEQLKLNVTRYTQYPYFEPPADNTKCMDDRTPPYTPDKFCSTYKWSQAVVAWEFFRQAKSAPDQLRMRMAHVWHQIFVIGDGFSGETYGVAEFQQRLRDHAFGTFENLLTKYALSPQLGNYQNWAKNVPEHDGIRPNENFARELMQLFTIGVNVLNDDGTPKLDAKGQLIPTYAQADIETLARILTGYTYPTRPGETPNFWGNRQYYVGDMIPYDEWHDRGSKSLLGGRLVLPPGGSAESEVRAALHTLVMHPNTPPFIAKQLIQKTVTSSPTPDYVSRIATVFRDNGAGVRGDLAAVTRAVLLDPEARGARKIDPQYGRLREPVLFWTAILRALDVTTDGASVRDALWPSAQDLFHSPTVFNYYSSDYTLAGGSIPGPEFGIFTSAELLNRANGLNDLLYNVDQTWSDHPLYGWKPRPWVINATGTPSPTMAAFVADAANVDALVDRLDRLLFHGAMSASVRRTIVNAVSKIDAGQPVRRAKLAVNLSLVTLDYQVQK